VNKFARETSPRTMRQIFSAMRILFYIFLIIFQYFAEILVRVIIIVKSFLGIIKIATIYANSPRPLNKTVAITKPSLTMPHTHLI